MTKILISSALILAAGFTVQADSIRLVSGKYLRGHVSGFTNSNWQVELENNITTNLPAPTVQTIDFDNALAQSAIELTIQSGTKGKISLYDKKLLSVENEDGLVNRIPLEQLTSILIGTARPAASALPPKDTPKKEVAKQLDNVAKIEEINDTDLPKHLVRGKVTIVDFYADWCGPCRRIGPHLEELTKQNDWVILRRVNVDNNKQLAGKFNISAIPNIIVYDKSGKNIGTVRGADPDGVDRLIAQAAAGN